MKIATYSCLSFFLLELIYAIPPDVEEQSPLDQKVSNLHENKCPPSKFRSVDGSCNNIENSEYGAIGDGILWLVPLKNLSESLNTELELPDPKELVEVIKHIDVPLKKNNDLSLLFALWGQLIAIDIAKIHQLDGDAHQSINGVSSFLDGSELYGNSLNELNVLRTFSDGKVEVKKCKRCSDSTVGILYQALLKEHNRVTEALHNMNPLLNDDELFYESRKIVLSEVQQITINEFVPVLLGQEIANKLNIMSSKGKHYKEYSRRNRPGTFMEAAVSGFALFDTLLPENVNEKVTFGQSTPFLISKFIENLNALERIIQKSRDHKIPPYKEYQRLCHKYLQLNSETLSYHETIQSLYGDEKDMDLIVGGLLEKPELGSVFGPTLTCIFAQQFEKLRNSDRFWFENDFPPSSFDLKKLKAIQHVSLSGLFCSAGIVNEIQPRSFYRQDMYLNAPMHCKNIAQLNLSELNDKVSTQKNSKISIKSNKIDSQQNIDENIMKLALNSAKEKLIERRKKEYELWLQNGGIDARSPEGTAASFSKANRNALLMANSSLFYELATNEIFNHMRRNRKKRQAFDDFSNNLQFIDINSAITGSISPITMEPQCEDFSAPCDPTTPFRTLTGHCNNLKNPSLGRSLTTFARLLPAVYEDGISLPRTTSVTGQPLPNPRSISSLIHPDISNLHTRYSLITMQFAQILDHDLTMTPIHKGFHESIPSCRSCNSAETVHPECNPIPIPPNDFFFPELNITDGSQFCFPFMRSLPGQQTLGPREQINQNTAFVDASHVYGENACICRKLRGFSGRLNSTTHPVRGKELLPLSPTHPECKAASGYCFIAGDGRASEQPGLTVLHTLFMREHNRIVEGLRGVNPHWNGEQLFDHARRINIAITQHITYNEFLPRVLSWNAVNLYGLKLLPTGYYKDFNPSCNPAIVTEFATAAYRIGHSLLRPHIPRLSAQHQPIDPPILLRDGFFKVDMLLQPGMVDEISRGLVATPMETLDQFITGEVTNHLFEDRRIPFSGIDLVALNIQRGRDHGIPSYNNYRALCNLKRAQTWEDLSREIPPEVITRLRRIYTSVDDIDLFPGGMSERPLQGGLVGPTFACIIAIQFRQLRKCDRFWYETNDPNLRFTEAQLAEIRKITLAKVICENLDEPGEIQRAAFDLPSNFLNPRVPCQSLPQIDLNAWRENLQGCQVSGRNIKVGDSAFPTPCTSCICTNEGLQCASLRITDCAQLAREWSREAIIKDEICFSQCGQTLSQTQQPNAAAGKLTVNLRPPPVQRSIKTQQFN